MPRPFLKSYIIAPKGAARLCQLDVCRALAAVAACFDVESNFLVIGQTCQACLLDCRDVYENIFAAAFGRDKAEAFS